MAKWICPKCNSPMECVGTGRNPEGTTRRYRCVPCGAAITTQEKFAFVTGGWVRPGIPKYRSISVGGQRQYLHIAIAENALGKKLPQGAEVHHVDSNRDNNEPTNLVICPNAVYHRLLHVRTAALTACGNASWRKCPFCKKWDDPEKMYTYRNQDRAVKQVMHRECHSLYESRRTRAVA